MAGEFRSLVKPQKYDCLYFCPHFYKGHREKINVKKISFATCRKEALLCCDHCFKEQVRKYVSLDSGLQSFFDEVKKILIQYYLPVSDGDFVIAVT